ncbi:hypothetical protein [Methylomonas albis]|uniref:Pentapeptide repeat-containing protein n=1 Tax=Methylomonas albis TaxID=1854563 RepID=A0ABR9D6N4_9GAMM|nr:pentapeptide repeat-containing protein [Methylomonas albis]MBD9358728.1 pentapeptide repeat-containing protein [Methylomonas albis]CAD6882178.1 hypothetical protein [Methylomonas albis]
MSEYKCPFCAAINRSDAGKCSTCQQPFPWAESEARIINLIKEREISRVRATLTVVEDLYATVREGKPFPVSSLKGLIFSWLLPHAVVIIGSLIGALLLSVQTYLIYQQIVLQKAQNDLLIHQTTLDVFDKTSRFKEMLSNSPNPEECIHRPREKITPKSSKTWMSPNLAAIRQIVRLSRNEPATTIPVVETLLVDDSGAVSSGAFLVLAELKRLGIYAPVDKFANFFGASLKAAPFEAWEFSNTNFRLADLSSARMQSGHFAGSWFSGANLHNAYLYGSLLTDTDLDCTDLRNADLSMTNVERANFEGADLDGANLSGINNWQQISSIKGANIRGVKNAPPGFEEWAFANGAKPVTMSKSAQWSGEASCVRRLPCE